MLFGLLVVSRFGSKLIKVWFFRVNHNYLQKFRCNDDQCHGILRSFVFFFILVSNFLTKTQTIVSEKIIFRAEEWTCRTSRVTSKCTSTMFLTRQVFT